MWSSGVYLNSLICYLDEFSEEFKEKDVNSAKTSNKPQKATSSVRPTSKSTGSLMSSSSQRTSKAASLREERTVQKMPVKKVLVLNTLLILFELVRYC